MSAFVVSKAHIDALVTFALFVAQRHNSTMMLEDCDMMGRTLWRENHKSVNYRYPDHKQRCPRYTFERRCPPLTPVEVLKSIDCLEYQSCEHKGWERSEARRILNEMRSNATSMLPGYDAAPWGIDS